MYLVPCRSANAQFFLLTAPAASNAPRSGRTTLFRSARRQKIDAHSGCDGAAPNFNVRTSYWW
jgi:hypothetical protein